jgi:flotillin
MGFITCGPNEVIVISGIGLARPKLIRGGRVWTWPGQLSQRLSLNVHTLIVQSQHIYTKLGVPVNVTGVAQVKVESQNIELLHRARQQFLGLSSKKMEYAIHETLEAHQRGIIGTMTVEEIFQDRTKFSEAVFQISCADLRDMGISVVSYTIKDLNDNSGYLLALGAKRTAEVQRDAQIGQAQANMESGIKKARGLQLKEAARFENDAEVAKSQRDFQLKKAEFDIQVQTEKANSDFSYELQAAKTKQKIKNEEVGVKVVERSKQIELMEQEIVRRERELDAQVKKPATAEKFRLETLAEANKSRTILEADAKAQAIKAKGEAEAFAINERAKANAEVMKMKADAYKEYKDAALIDMVLKTLPKIAAEVAAPLANVERIKIVSAGGADVGISRITNEVVDIMTSLPQTVNKLTGIDITKILHDSIKVE